MSVESLREEIVRDNTSGAQELTKKTGQLLVLLLGKEKGSTLERLRGSLLQLALAVLSAHPAMASLFNLFNECLHGLEAPADAQAGARTIRLVTQRLLRRMDEHNRAISPHLFDLLKEGTVVITHSASRSVREALCSSWKMGRRFSVICTESRPACEGSILARHLARQGIPTSLTTDALSFSLLQGSRPGEQRPRAVLVGADSITLHGILNKAGTLGLAVAAQSWSVPFFVLAGSEKFLPSIFPVEKMIKEKPPAEILSRPCQGLRVINRYFDITPLPYVTAVITEEGALPPHDLEGRLNELTPHPKLLEALATVISAK